ncbi:hypothetical protein M2446_001246, partial [Breznakia sp. PM6-1]|nr:hypothetical protein [Breznakia sp. PM6-1]
GLQFSTISPKWHRKKAVNLQGDKNHLSVTAPFYILQINS